ncbi:type IX secretion system PorP/SprF family membrane protein [Lutibacter sp. Hel_I_33_5]|uniref:PorP/SprF family type IX secretion system membrane protein n=1 Tax=Lutibacter sp. Hel_I_33_5 TaxID=1566289 RepID=UPI0011A5839C|nr:type IX secretion system membrane protein PorP/SprF [Lutibacter sp. Hel_I_33_5]TVZ56135.1 type IX secretion system PorP/SprF family membrane protein [Lutibacter sp. Hel_I_33_5]TVZ56575.1 type IX secretion system PorP/SprF family membrane protein [Lutibacter sp. Hel_I_33_5]
MKLEKILVGLLMLLSVSIYAQQDPQYTHYMYNMNIVNPAYAGSQEAMTVNFLGRSQWIGIQGAPQTVALGIHAPVGKKVGLGLSIIADRLGPVREQSSYADFSYTLQVGEDKHLALGLKAGFSFLDVNLPFIQTTNPGDVAFANRINRALPNFGAGVFYYTDKFYAGVSLPNMLKTLHFDKAGGSITKASDVAHYFITSGYVFDLSETLKFKPSFMVKTAPGAPTSIDLSGNILLNDKLEFGLSYRFDDSISTLINVRATNNLRLGYAYDHTVSNLGQFNSGSHEVFLLFDFSFVSDKIKSPRFF